MRILYLLLFVIGTNHLDAQNGKRVNFDLGYERRVGPEFPAGFTYAYRTPLPWQELSKHLNGSVLRFNISFGILRSKLFVNYEYCLRNDHFFIAASTTTLQRSENAWMTDNLISLLVPLRLTNGNEIRFAAGVGWMNRGTEFGVREAQVVQGTDSIIFQTVGDLHYTSSFLSTTYHLGRMGIGLRIHYVTQSNFLLQGAFFLPAMLISYNLWQLPSKSQVPQQQPSSINLPTDMDLDSSN